MRSKGYTLIELLIVLAIIAILSGIFGLSLIRSLRTAELRDAATQVAADFKRARSQAQKGSADVVIVTPGNTAGSTYTVNGSSRSLERGVTLICVSGCSPASAATNTITYSAPYGELVGAVGDIMEVRSPYNGIAAFQIRVVGVTGKIIMARVP